MFVIRAAMSFSRMTLITQTLFPMIRPKAYPNMLDHPLSEAEVIRQTAQNNLRRIAAGQQFYRVRMETNNNAYERDVAATTAESAALLAEGYIRSVYVGHAAGLTFVWAHPINTADVLTTTFVCQITATNTPIEGEILNDHPQFFDCIQCDEGCDLLGHGNEFPEVIHWELRASADATVQVHSVNPTFATGCDLRIVAQELFRLGVIDFHLFECAMSYSFYETPAAVEGVMQTNTVEYRDFFWDIVAEYFYHDNLCGSVLRADTSPIGRAFTWSPMHLISRAPIMGKPFSATVNLSSR
jgi:hypothetical protein